MVQHGKGGSLINRVFALSDIRRLTFTDAELERGYRAYETGIARQSLRRGLALGAIGISCFGLIDAYLFDPEIVRRLLFLRLGVVNLYFLVVFFLTFRPIYVKYSRQITGSAPTVAAVAMWLMILIAPAPDVHPYYTGILLALFFDAFLFGRCWAGYLISGSFVGVLYAIGALFLFDMSPSNQLISIIFALATVGVGVAAAYAREHTLRRSYALGESLRIERDRVAEANRGLEQRVSEGIAEAMVQTASRQQAESALAAERDLLSSVYDAMNDIVVVFDPTSGRPVRWNRAAQDMTGLSRREVSGLRIPGDWLTPQDQARARQAMATILSEGRAAVTLTITHRNGHQVPIEFMGSTVQIPDGGQNLIIAIGRNLTERRHAQQALRASRERLELALQSANMGIWEYDWRSGTLILGRHGAELMGVPATTGPVGDVVRQFGAHMQPDQRDHIRSIFADHLGRKNDRFDAEFAYEIDGNHMWLTMSGGVAERDDTGAPVRTVGLLRDITDRRRLDERVRETAKLEAIGRLAGGVAHDFNNLLTVINGYGEMAMMGVDAESELHEMLQVILEQGNRAAALTRQLLTFSRREPLDLRAFDMSELVHDLGRMLRRLIGEDVDLVLSPVVNLPMVQADPTQLEQVIMNLAVNARDAMPDGGKLTITTERTDVDEALSLRLGDLDPGQYVALTVADTGHGMDEETLSHLFEPFFTTKPQGQGTGLGLAVVYGVMERIHGGIDVTSVLGQGTTFRLYLPASNSAQGDDAPEQEPPQGGTETVLLVEDEAAVRSLVRRMLQRWGYQVIEAINGAEAIEVASGLSEPIDLLLTDVVMPSTTGPALAARLRRRWPDLPVLFMTGYDNMLTADRLDANTRVLIKPLGQSELSLALRELLGDA